MNPRAKRKTAMNKPDMINCAFLPTRLIKNAAMGQSINYVGRIFGFLKSPSNLEGKNRFSNSLLPPKKTPPLLFLKIFLRLPILKLAYQIFIWILPMYLYHPSHPILSSLLTPLSLTAHVVYEWYLSWIQKEIHFAQKWTEHSYSIWHQLF